MALCDEIIGLAVASAFFWMPKSCDITFPTCAQLLWKTRRFPSPKVKHGLMLVNFVVL